MENLQTQIDQINRTLTEINQKLITPIDVTDIYGLLFTSSTALETANRVAGKPTALTDQLFIDTSTATKRLYIYDATGNVWYKVTIA